MGTRKDGVGSDGVRKLNRCSLEWSVYHCRSAEGSRGLWCRILVRPWPSSLQHLCLDLVNDPYLAILKQKLKQNKNIKNKLKHMYSWSNIQLTLVKARKTAFYRPWLCAHLCVYHPQHTVCFFHSQ
jgi:hypothetical protein